MWSYFFLQLLLPASLIFVLSTVLLALWGRSLGIRRLYVRVLLNIFQVLFFFSPRIYLEAQLCSTLGGWPGRGRGTGGRSLLWVEVWGMRIPRVRGVRGVRVVGVGGVGVVKVGGVGVVKVGVVGGRDTHTSYIGVLRRTRAKCE